MMLGLRPEGSVESPGETVVKEDIAGRRDSRNTGREVRESTPSQL